MTRDNTGKWTLFGLVGALGVGLTLWGCQGAAKPMSSGEALYRVKCSSCHGVIARERHDSETWRVYVDRYGKKLTSQQKSAMLEYLTGIE